MAVSAIIQNYAGKKLGGFLTDIVSDLNPIQLSKANISGGAQVDNSIGKNAAAIKELVKQRGQSHQMGIKDYFAGKKMGNKAILWGAVAGTIPDLDVFFRAFYEPIDAALVHRGFSHSIVFSLLASPILAYIFTYIYRKRFEFNLWLKLFFFSII